MPIGKICVREVYLADAGESTYVAAQRMREHGVGTLVALDKDKKPFGIVTDRDLAMQVIAAGKDPAEVKVAQVMTVDPRSLREDTPIEEGLRLMRGGKCRRLPVVDDKDALQGLVSIDDILELLAEEMSQIAKIIESQVERRGI
ncbi:MAG: CBS domain-containing protein [Candidatus Brocadiales bacterium]|nr:CBS domain-containing protein [Candidatus Brocadiales bacterium]